MRFVCLIVIFFFLENGFSQSILSPKFQKIQNRIETTDLSDTIIALAQKGYDIAVENDNSSEKGLALLIRARAHISKAEYDTAVVYLKKANFWAHRSKNKNLEALVLLETGKNYQLTSSPDKALYLMLQAKRIFERYNYNQSLVRTNVYLAEYYRSLQRFEDGERHIRLALKDEKKVKITNKLRISIYNRAAALKTETRDHDSAFFYSKLATDLAQKVGLLNEKAISLNEVGFVHENMKQFNKALINYEEAKKIWLESKQLRNWVLVTENIARTYRKMGQFAKSNEIVMPAENVAKERKWYSNLLSIYILKGGNYVLLNNLTEAKNYDHLAMGVKLINYQENNLKAIKDIKAKYETEKKEELIREKNEQIKNSREKLKVEKEGQRKLYIALFVLLVTLIVVAVLAINRIIILRQLKSKTKELEVSNENLNVSLSKSEVLLQEVHHRVKNNLQFITSIIELEIDSNSPSSKKESLVDVSRRISAMSLVHELLYNYDNIEKIAAKKYIDDLVVSIDEMINRQQIPIHFELKIEDVLFEVKQCIAVGMIISELVSNSIKHAFKDEKLPKISIYLTKNELSKTIILNVKDNGLGINEDISHKKGLGSRLVHIFTIQLNGQYTINSKNQFSFSFEFPYIE